MFLLHMTLLVLYNRILVAVDKSRLLKRLIAANTSLYFFIYAIIFTDYRAQLYELGHSLSNTILFVIGLDNYIF
jgi:hypothetical protein